MNLQAIETVVRRLFTDAEFRARAIADPATALDEYRLASEERVALTKLCVRLASGEAVESGPKAYFWW